MIKNFEQFLNETKNSKLLCDFGCCYIGEFLKKNPDFNETEFTEYVGAHNKADRDSGELNDICKEEILRLAKEFTKKKNISTEINEALTVTSDVIDIKKLLQYASAIKTLCNDEYGYTFFKPDENHVFVCVGDGNPFDDDMLKSEYMPSAIRKGDYNNEKLINITIENESMPPKNAGWYVCDREKLKVY